MLEQNGSKSTLTELAEIRAAARAQASGEAPAEDAELPEGAAPLEASADEPAVEEKKEDAAPAAAPAEEEETLIKIGDQEFKTQADALKYAEKLVQEKEVSEAYNMGIRETLEHTRAAAPPPPPEEDKFEEEFYANPKETLRKVKESATQEALAVINAEKRKEELWTTFFSQNPDLSGQRLFCEHILQQNMGTIGKMVDVDKAMKLLAQKTRAHFQDYIEKAKPRTELSRSAAQAVSPGGAQRLSVTPQKKDDVPLTMAQQMRKLKLRA